MLPARPPVAPIDLYSSFLTFEEVFDQPGGIKLAESVFARLDLEFTLAALAELMARYEVVGADAARVDSDVVDSVFVEGVRPRVRGLLEGRRRMLAPQGILLAAKVALQRCVAGGDRHIGRVVAAVLAVQDDPYGNPEEDGNEQLFAELVRNAAFAQTVDVATLLGRMQMRWHDLPEAMRTDDRFVDLDAEYRAVVGVSLTDLTVVALALYSRTMEASTRGAVIPADFLSNLRWSQQYLDAILDLIAASPEQLDAEVPRLNTDYGFEWSFDAFRRYPVVRLSGGRMVVISPRFLIERAFGWTALFDVKSRLSALDAKARLGNFEAFFRRVCEEEAMQTLESMTGGANAHRVYREDQLKAAFGPKAKTADGAIAYPEAWVVVEVATSQLRRVAVVGGSAAEIDKDLRRVVVDEVRQIASTIAQLRRRESALTGTHAHDVRRFVPLLVSTEGFPMNPAVHQRIHQLLEAEGLLQEPDIGPLHILDQEELNIAESCVAAGLGSLVSLLDEHARSGLARVPFKHWLAVEKGASLDRPPRVQESFERAWSPALAALKDSDVTTRSDPSDDSAHGSPADP
jgi:hypothetical protein